MKYQIIPVTHYQQNCSLVSCEATNKAALIDPGGDVELLLQVVEREGVELEKILLTHGHMDHVSGAKQLAEQTQVPIIGPHVADTVWMENLPKQAQMFGFPDVGVFMPDHWLQEEDEVSVGDVVFKVLHCPGHTPGHIVFYQAESKTAFVGDVLFNGSIGRTDFPQGDHYTLIASIKEKLLPLGDDITFVPGHGPNSTFGFERLNNPFLQ